MGIIFFFFFLYNLITIYLQNILKSILKIPSIRVCVLIITYLKYNDRKKSMKVIIIYQKNNLQKWKTKF